MSPLVPFPPRLDPTEEAIALVEAATEGILAASWAAVDKAGHGAIARQLRADVNKACARARRSREAHDAADK